MIKKVSLLLIVWSTFCSLAFASLSTDVKQGNQAFEDGQYRLALEAYSQALQEDPQSPLLNFNAGTAQYKQENFTQAIDHFHKSLLTDDDTLKQSAYYNLGNSFYRQAIVREDEAIDDAIAQVQESLKTYEKAMALNSEDQDAQHNYEFVKKELMRLEKKKKQMEQEQDKQCSLGDKKKKEGEESSEKRDQTQQDQQQSDGQQKDQQNQNQEQKASEAEEQKQENGGQTPSVDQEQESAKEEARPSAQGEQKEQEQEQKKEQAQKQEQASEGSEEQSEQGADHQQSVPQEPKHMQALQQFFEREAQMLLDDYQQNEEPKQMLLLKEHHFDYKAVEKDW